MEAAEDPEFLEAMRRARIRGALVGVESVTPECLKAVFKNFNDAFGHEAGDHVLKEVGQVLQKNVRDSDIACRFGGEEFTLILPDADCDTALEIGNRIRNAVKELQLVMGRQHLGHITISAGISVFPSDGDTIRRLLATADEIVENIAPELKPGDVVSILSNGGFGGIYEKLPARIRSLNEVNASAR